MMNNHPFMMYKDSIKMEYPREYPSVKIEQSDSRVVPNNHLPNHFHSAGMYNYLDIDLKELKTEYPTGYAPMPPPITQPPTQPPSEPSNHNQIVAPSYQPPLVVPTERHVCEYCDKQCSTKGNLIVHKRTHTMEKPYSCNECGKSFTAKGNLNTHILSHSEYRPFLCVICGKGFTTKGNMTVHMRSHSKDKPYECTVCAKRFTTKGNLLTHSITHKEVKPFQCDYCNKQFSTNNNLTIHKRTHTQERPFNCTHCSKSFYSKGTLSAHFRTRHMEKNTARHPPDPRVYLNEQTPAFANHNSMQNKHLNLPPEYGEHSSDAGASDKKIHHGIVGFASSRDSTTGCSSDVKPIIQPVL